MASTFVNGRTVVEGFFRSTRAVHRLDQQLVYMYELFVGIATEIGIDGLAEVIVVTSLGAIYVVYHNGITWNYESPQTAHWAKRVKMQVKTISRQRLQTSAFKKCCAAIGLNMCALKLHE